MNETNDTAASTQDFLASRPAWLEKPVDVNKLDLRLWPKTTFRNNQGVVCIGQVPVTDLVKDHGSALYVLDEEDFKSRCLQFVKAFEGWQVYYASKAFLTRDLARWAVQCGLNLDVCSGNEMLVGLTAGVPAAKMGLHGNNKSLSELRLALKNGVGRIIVDSLIELERLEQLCTELDTQATVLVRVTPGVEAHTHEYIATAHDDQKFGFAITNGLAMQALMKAHYSPRIKLAGVHCHIGSQIFDIDGLLVAADRCLKLIANFYEVTNCQLEDLDLGGGYGIAYTAKDSPKPIEVLASQLKDYVVKQSLAYGLDLPNMSIEPGRAIVGPTTVALYTVGTVKPVRVDEGAVRVYVSVDGGMSDNIRPALYGAEYCANLVNRCSDAQPMLCRVVGKHCEGGDILVKDVFLPQDIKAGDLIAVPGCGAYCRPMASNYNYLTKPAVVGVKDGSVKTLLRAETLADLLALDQGEVVCSLEGLLDE